MADVKVEGLGVILEYEPDPVAFVRGMSILYEHEPPPRAIVRGTHILLELQPVISVRVTGLHAIQEVRAFAKVRTSSVQMLLEVEPILDTPQTHFGGMAPNQLRRLMVIQPQNARTAIKPRAVSYSILKQTLYQEGAIHYEWQGTFLVESPKELAYLKYLYDARVFYWLDTTPGAPDVAQVYWLGEFVPAPEGPDQQAFTVPFRLSSKQAGGAV